MWTLVKYTDFMMLAKGVKYLGVEIIRSLSRDILPSSFISLTMNAAIALNHQIKFYNIKIMIG